MEFAKLRCEIEEDLNANWFEKYASDAERIHYLHEYEGGELGAAFPDDHDEMETTLYNLIYKHPVHGDILLKVKQVVYTDSVASDFSWTVEDMTIPDHN